MTAGAELRQSLSDEAERFIEDSLHTGRNNQAAGRWWSGFNTWVGVPGEIAATILAGGAGISALLDQQPIVTASLAVVSAALGAVHAFLKPGEKADAYTLKGNRFIALRNETRLFRDLDLKTAASDDELVVRMRELRKRYAELNEVPPLVVEDRHYQRAKKSIEAGESDYTIDRRAREGT